MKLTTERLKKLIREELESTNEGMVDKFPNPTFEKPTARVSLRSGTHFYSVLFQGLGPNKRAAFEIPYGTLSPKAEVKLISMKGQGMTIGDAPGLAEHIASFVSNMDAPEIARAEVK